MNFKSVITAVLLALFLLASSSYIALKLGAMPWPIIFSIVAAAGFMRLFGRFSKHELNIAHAGASIGGLVASALVFTIPGLWYLSSQGVEVTLPTTFSLILMILAGGIFGIAVSVPIRKQLIDVEKLPFPSGTAGAKLIQAAFKGKAYVYIALLAGLAAALFAVARDIWFPAGWIMFTIAGIAYVFYPMPLAIGVGYILGRRPSFSWFYGSVVGWLIILPILVWMGISNPASWVRTFGMGLLFGAGLGFLLHFLFTSGLKMGSASKLSQNYIILSSLLSIFVLAFIGVPILASIITVLLTLIAVYLAARMTGETNIDPLEQFGIIISLVCTAVYAVLKFDLSLLSSFMIVSFTAVATAIAGDTGHDFKVAKLIGTDPRAIIKVNIITVIVVALAGPFILELIRLAYSAQLFTALMPAPQAQLVAGSLFGFEFPLVFIAGIVLGAIVEFIIRFKKSSFMMPFSIGVFLGIPFGILLFIGGLFAKKKSSDKGIVIAAGIMGGEGIIGFIAGVLIFSGLALSSTIFIILLVALIIAVLLRPRGEIK